MAGFTFGRTFEFRIVSTTDSFDVGFHEGRLLNITQTHVTNGRIKKGPILEQNDFRVEQLSRTLRTTVTASFRFISSPHVLTELPTLAEVHRLKPTSISVSGFLHKADRGRLEVEVLDANTKKSLCRVVYERSQLSNNEMHFAFNLLD